MVVGIFTFDAGAVYAWLGGGDTLGEYDGLCQGFELSPPNSGVRVRDDDCPLELKNVQGFQAVEFMVSARSVAPHAAQARTPHATVFKTDIVNLLFDDR